MPDFSIVIQAGGESRRMGRDKGLLPFLGQPLVQRVYDRLKGLGADILVTTNDAEGYRFLDAPLIPDTLPGRGALGGLLTALTAAGSSLVGVVACDMPFANADLFSLELNILHASQEAAIIPRHPGGIEPFHAIYRRELCLPFIQKALANGRLRVDSWFHEVPIHYLEPEAWRPIDAHHLTFLNINTPQDVRRAEDLAREDERPGT